MHVGVFAVAVAAFFVRPRAAWSGEAWASTLGSLILIVIGLTIRAWASSVAGSHTSLPTIVAPTLATTGPFGYVRNPIYLASILLGFGMLTLIGDPWMAAIYAAVFLFLYLSIVPAEEACLRAAFGASYVEYCANVPRVLPRFTPWRRRDKLKFERGAVAREALLGVYLMVFYGVLRAAAWLREWAL